MVRTSAVIVLNSDEAIVRVYQANPPRAQASSRPQSCANKLKRRRAVCRAESSMRDSKFCKHKLYNIKISFELKFKYVIFYFYFVAKCMLFMYICMLVCCYAFKHLTKLIFESFDVRLYNIKCLCQMFSYNHTTFNFSMEYSIFMCLYFVWIHF